MEEHWVLVSGFAITPKGTPLNEVYKHIGVQLLIDKRTNRIIKSDFSVISQLTREQLQSIVNGFCVDEPIEVILTKMKNHIFIPSLGAIQQAFKVAVDRYREIK